MLKPRTVFTIILSLEFSANIYLKNVSSRYCIANEDDCKGKKCANDYVYYADPRQKVMTFEWLTLRRKVLYLQVKKT